MAYATDMATFNTNMTNLGDKVRTLGEITGTNNSKTPTQMASIINIANGTIADQGTLINQIITLVDTKFAIS